LNLKSNVDRHSYSRENLWRGLQYWTHNDTYSVLVSGQFISHVPSLEQAVNNRDALEREYVLWKRGTKWMSVDEPIDWQTPKGDE
jgi:hypothetical protein